MLITQSALRLLAGSELVAVELAEYLQGQGASVVLYTCFLADPLASLVREKHLNVVTDDELLRLRDFDYVWVHHQVLPVSLLDQLRELPAEAPAFVFLHMSGLETHLLEQPYIWEMEQRLSSMTLFVSTEARDCVNRLCVDVAALAGGSALFRNPAPPTFARLEHKPRAAPRRVLFVSNHPPAEIAEVKTRLRAAGFEVVGVGEGQDHYRTIEPEFLREFDVVVTIGKTVQYCLCANVPVYIYDRFGGPGFLSLENEATAAAANFSGRGFAQKTVEQICGEITAGYREAAQYQVENRQRFIEELSIDRVLPALLTEVERSKRSPSFEVSHFYWQYLRSVLVMMKWKFIHENELALHEGELERARQQLRAGVEAFDRVDDERDSALRELNDARSWLAVQERDAEVLRAALDEARAATETERREREVLELELKAILESSSWQTTQRLRAAASLMPDGLKTRLKGLLSRRR